MEKTYAAAREHTRAAYDEIADDYDKRRGRSTILVPVVERFGQLLPKNSVVLEAGCGTGRDLVRLQHVANRVIGVDLSQSMLRIAAAKGGKELIQGEFCSLPFRDRTFDGCWAAASLLHLPKPAVPQALKDVRRLLKQGGSFFLCLKEGKGEGFRRDRRHARYFALYERDEMSALLRDNGFRVIESWSSADEEGREPWLNWFVS